MHPTNSCPRREPGQIIVIFALALVVIVAMVGLVLDGGSTFAQRRTQQNAADLAALAGPMTTCSTGIRWPRRLAARSVAARNGFTDGAPAARRSA